MRIEKHRLTDDPVTMTALEFRLQSALSDFPARVDVDFLRKSPDHASHRSARVIGQDTLLVRVTSSQIHLALFRHEDTRANAPCPECLERRLLAMLAPDEQWALHTGAGWEGCDAPSHVELAIEQVRLFAQHLLSQRDSMARQVVLTLDLRTHASRSDELLRDSFCCQCVAWSFPNEQTATLPLRKSLRATSGKSRMKGLLDYDLPGRALVNPVCGAAAADVSVGYVQCATSPVFASYVQRAFQAKPRIVGWSGLCTRTDESRVAGMLEALERQAGMFAHPASIAVVDSYRRLSERAMNPEACFAYTDEAYELPLGLTRFSPDLPIEWVWGYSIMSERSLLVPKQLVFYDRVDSQNGPKLVDNNSSGCALGSCYEEAILKALLELIERDSFVIAWHRQLSFPKVDPASCLDYRSASLLDRIDHLKYDISLLDGRLDMRTPAVIAVARRRDGGSGAMAVGASASTDPQDALRAALLECVTAITEMPLMFAKREQRIRQLAEDYYKVESVMDHSLLYALPEMADKLAWLDGSDKIHPFDKVYGEDRDWFSTGDIAHDLNNVLEELRACGITEAVVVDLTTPEQCEFDLKTVRVIVPGLAPIDFGFPRNRACHLPRLWSAPEARSTPTATPNRHHGLNCLPHPFP